MGEDKVTTRINNGELYKERVVNVIIDTDEQPNVLAGTEATLRHYKSDYSFEAEFDELRPVLLPTATPLTRAAER